jgi:hypothetical protein
MVCQCQALKVQQKNQLYAIMLGKEICEIMAEGIVCVDVLLVSL